jgi:4-amino-4-deoxychorismate lyase
VSGQNAIWLNGTRVESLPLPDRGLDFGDGVFETFLVHEGNPLFPGYHIDRLKQGLKTLRIPDCLDSIQSQLETAASEAKGIRWSALRLSVIRGPGPRGYRPSPSSAPRIVIYVSSLDRDCATMDRPAVLCVAELRLSDQPLLARIKHLNRLEQVMASVQAQSLDTEEAVMFDKAGHLTSVIAGNIFLVCHGELLTPVLVECGVAGTRRRLIIEKWAHEIGLKIRETRLSSAELFQADEVFFSNSLQTVRPIAKIGNKSWESHNVCKALFQRFLEELP